MLQATDKFAVLRLSGCAGCEVLLLNAEEWIKQHRLVYMPLVLSAYDVPQVDVLLVSGGVRADEDLYNLPTRPIDVASDAVRISQVAGLLPASFRPHLTVTPLPSANG